MGALTRSAVIIRPLPPYLAWAKRDDTTDIAEQVFEDLRRAPHVYLLPEYGDADSEREILDDFWPDLFAALVHDSKLTVNDPNPEASHRPILYDSGRPSSVIWFRTLHATTDSATRPPRDRARSRSPIIDLYRKNAFSTRAWSW